MHLLTLLFLLPLYAAAAPGPPLPADTLPQVQAIPSARIAPNPVKSRCELLVRHFEAGEAWVIIHNNLGTVVYREKRLVTGPADKVVLFIRLPPGNYICTAQQGARKARSSFLVVP